MIQRFTKHNNENLILALHSQSLIRDDVVIAKMFAQKVTLIEFKAGSTIISQNSTENDLFFILSGSVAIRVNNRDIALRESGTHVGEMAMIDPGARRSASVIAVEPTITARVSMKDFYAIANEHPIIWRLLALELGQRLRQRNRFIRIPNTNPQVFIGSSKESLPILKSLTKELGKSKNIVLLPWIADIFWPSNTAMEDIESQLPNVDFAVLIFGPDDKIISRKTTSMGPRDNVILEYGLFLGSIGRERTYFLKPKHMNIRLPSDLFGLKPIEYDYDINTGNVDIRGACKEIMRCLKKFGPK
jgi:CRP/FNR family transcriptional regulator, cyclic AMP receptor protein